MHGAATGTKARTRFTTFPSAESAALPRLRVHMWVFPQPLVVLFKNLSKSLLVSLPRIHHRCDHRGCQHASDCGQGHVRWNPEIVSTHHLQTYQDEHQSQSIVKEAEHFH